MYLTNNAIPTDSTYLLKQAFLIFSRGEQHVMTRAEVERGPNGPKLTHLTEVTDDLFTQLMALRGEQALKYVAPGVLAQNDAACAWFTPARTRTLHFNATFDTSLNDLSGQAFPQPPLVFVSRRSRSGTYLQVFALQCDERPQPDTPLMLAPYMNVYDHHGICFGPNVKPSGTNNTFQEAWETLFYATPFSHSGGTHRRWSEALTHKELWEDAACHGRFNPEHLRPCRTPRTLENLLCTPFTQP